MLVLVPIAAVALLQRRFRRYALRDTSLQVMRGVIAQRDWIVPYENVQVVTLRAGWLQRRLGMASVLVDTAGAGGGGAPDVVDLATADARALAMGLVARIG
jgi:putative membrane protein